MCWSLGSLVRFEETTDMCAAVNGHPWQISLRGNQARDSMIRQETACLSLEKLSNPLCQFGSYCWCMMGKKNIPPSFSATL